MAKILKYEVESIHVYPFGFSATIVSFSYANPYEIILILLSGIGLHFIYPFFIQFFELLGFISKNYSEYLNQMNTSIFLFNLLPIFPLDGGRFLFAFFRFFLDYRKSKILTLFISLICILFLIYFNSLSMNIILLFLLYLLIKEFITFDFDLVEYHYYQRNHLKLK